MNEYSTSEVPAFGQLIKAILELTKAGVISGATTLTKIAPLCGSISTADGDARKGPVQLLSKSAAISLSRVATLV